MQWNKMVDIGQVEEAKIPTKIFADRVTDRPTHFSGLKWREMKIFVIVALCLVLKNIRS